MQELLNGGPPKDGIPSIDQPKQDLNTAIIEELDGTVIPSSTAFSFVYPAFFIVDE